MTSHRIYKHQPFFFTKFILAINITPRLMKRILLLVFILTCFASCENDSDDVIIICDTPSGLTATEVTHNRVLLSWTNTNETKAVTIEYGLSGFQAGTGTIATTSESSITLETSFLCRRRERL